MARITLYNKSVTVARKHFKACNGADSTQNMVMRRVRKGRYILNVINVTAGQRHCRNIFALAQKFAKADIDKGMRKRHWSRIARRHKIASAYRAAVSHYINELRKGSITEEDLFSVDKIIPRVSRTVPFVPIISPEFSRRPDKKLIMHPKIRYLSICRTHFNNYNSLKNKALGFFFDFSSKNLA